MNEIPGLNLLPEKIRGPIAFVLLISPYITRAYHAIVNGGGLRGVINAIWFGTNVPKDKQ
jgi:hypothetical protein